MYKCARQISWKLEVKGKDSYLYVNGFDVSGEANHSEADRSRHYFKRTYKSDFNFTLAYPSEPITESRVGDFVQEDEYVNPVDFHIHPFYQLKHLSASGNATYIDYEFSSYLDCSGSVHSYTSKLETETVTASVANNQIVLNSNTDTVTTYKQREYNAQAHQQQEFTPENCEVITTTNNSNSSASNQTDFVPSYTFTGSWSAPSSSSLLYTALVDGNYSGTASVLRTFLEEIDYDFLVGFDGVEERLNTLEVGDISTAVGTRLVDGAVHGVCGGYIMAEYYLNRFLVTFNEHSVPTNLRVTEVEEAEIHVNFLIADGEASEIRVVGELSIMEQADREESASEVSSIAFDEVLPRLGLVQSFLTSKTYNYGSPSVFLTASPKAGEVRIKSLSIQVGESFLI